MAGREASVTHRRPWSTGAGRGRIAALGSNPARCPASSEGAEVVLFPPRLAAGRVPLQRPSPARHRAPCCREQNGRGVVYGANLYLLCNSFLGKTGQIQLCSLSLLDCWCQLLFCCWHLLTSQLRGGCRASPLLNPECPGVHAVPLPSQVWVAQPEG